MNDKISLEISKNYESYFRKVLGSAPISCFLLNNKMEIIDHNQEALDIFATGSENTVPFWHLKQFYPKHQPGGVLTRDIMREYIDLVNKQGEISFEWMFQTLDGDPLPASVTLIACGEQIIAFVIDRREVNRALTMVRELEEIAYSDALTGAYNRHYFIDKAMDELRTSINLDFPFHLAMVDLDYFKRVNDEHGHLVGDEVLRIVAMRMRQSTRIYNPVARYGGEEFIIMLPKMERDDAAKLAWRIRDVVTETPFEVDGLKLAITVSVGLASKEGPTDTLNDIMKRADKAMYAAKSAGRNTVVVYSES